LQEQPGNHAIWCSMGRAYHELGMYEEGLKCFLKSAEIKNDYALAYANASATLIQLSRWEDAEKSAKLALDCDPNEINSHRNLAHSYLAKGEWIKGWEAYGKSLNSKFRKEWVYGEEQRWNGLPDKRLVIYGEQGLGDEIFFASCVPDAIKVSQKVWIDCDPKLAGLFQRSFPEAEVHGTRLDPNPQWLAGASINARCAIGGLPEFFRRTDKEFPGTPFLKACPERKLMWQSLFKSYGTKVVGITTHGGLKHTNRKGRKLELNHWLPILKKPGFTFVSLDYKENPELQMFCDINGVEIKTFNTVTMSKDYDDTAGLISALDLVLGVNTTALHCSAGLGVRTVCLVPKCHQWRYARPYMPWYKDMRLIHQNDRDWGQVFKDISDGKHGKVL